MGIIFGMDTPDKEIDPIVARHEKLNRLIESGVNPYPSESHPHTPLKQILDHCDSQCKNPGDSDDKVYSAAGRIRALRGQGGIVFLDLADDTAKMQVVAKADVLSESQKLIENLDLGDIIWVEGATFRTQRGECSILPHEITLLSKSLRPLPDKWSGLKDQEVRFRQRYLDLIMNDQARDTFQKRVALIDALRTNLKEQGFMEVETPVLEHVPGGADAEPFITHHNTLDIDLFLRISLELHLKRLLVGGFPKVFEFGRVFRNEGMSMQHLQEFTMLEFYWAYADYLELMEMVEELYASSIEAVFGTTKLERPGGEILDFTPPWPRVEYAALLREHAGIDVITSSDEEILAAVKEHRVDSGAELGRARLIDQLYKKVVRPKLVQPQFLIDPPLIMSPLAKPHRKNPRLAERFWVLAAGAEIGNGFSELNDPIDQKRRFDEQEKMRLSGDAEAQRLDHDYVRALEYGMPPAAGFGVGVDRLLAIITNQSIRETVLFPTMRPEQDLGK